MIMYLLQGTVSTDITMATMQREVQVRQLAELIQADDVLRVEQLLSTKNKLTWRDIAEHELSLETLSRTVLKESPLAPLLVSCEVQSLSCWHLAALRGIPGVLVALLEIGVSVDLPLVSGTTALQLACLAGLQDIVKLLLEVYTAQVNIQDW